VEALTSEERDIDLATDSTVNYNAPALQKWLADNSLYQRPEETTLQFAFRAVLTMRKKVKYEAYKTEDAVNTCKLGRSNCFGISYLYAAIPARVRIGRWAASGSEEETQIHAQVEFYADKVGWVPVDISRTLEHSDIPPDWYFGYDDGDFITVHTNTDLILGTPEIGMRTTSILLGEAIWFFHSDAKEPMDHTMHYQWIADWKPVPKQQK
jgi:transglutaminase-like putative cysteine protease